MAGGLKANVQRREVLFVRVSEMAMLKSAFLNCTNCV